MIRSLAILPQAPAFSITDLKKEKKLRMEAERKAIWHRRAAREQLAIPEFRKLRKPREVLLTYAERRDELTPRDAAAALYALGRLAKASALKVGSDPLVNHPIAKELRADVAASAPHMLSRELANALLGAAYMRVSDELMLSALCAAAADKAARHFDPQDVASCVYALGRLGRRDEELLPELLSRVAIEAPYFHGIELTLTASGLADLDVAPPTALEALSQAAIPKLEQFGGEELPKLLAALASLGWHDKQLVRMAMDRLPLLLTEMRPKALAEMAASLVSSGEWIPSALNDIAEVRCSAVHRAISSCPTPCAALCVRASPSHTLCAVGDIHTRYPCERRGLARLDMHKQPTYLAPSVHGAGGVHQSRCVWRHPHRCTTLGSWQGAMGSPCSDRCAGDTACVVRSGGGCEDGAPAGRIAGGVRAARARAHNTLPLAAAFCTARTTAGRAHRAHCHPLAQ